MKSRTLIIVISSVAVFLLIVGLIAYAVFARGAVRLSVFNCSAQVQRLEREAKNDIQTFKNTDFITLQNTSTTEVTAGGDCVSNPPGVTLVKTYTVSSMGSEVVKNLEENLAKQDVSVNAKESLYYYSDVCGASYANLETTRIPNASRNQDYYQATLSGAIDSCDTYKKYKTGPASNYSFQSVDKVRIERHLRY